LVEISADGSLLVENQVLTTTQLTDLLRQRGSAKTAVTVAGNDTASLQQVMSVIDAIKAGGASVVLPSHQIARRLVDWLVPACSR